MAINNIETNKTMELSLELATILALSYQPDSITTIKLIPINMPADSPIIKGLALDFSLKRFWAQ